MRYTIYLILGFLFVLNLFLRVRIMKLNKAIQENQIAIDWKDMLTKSKFNQMVEERYPQHAKLLTDYRNLMLGGILLIITAVFALLGISLFGNY